METDKAVGDGYMTLAGFNSATAVKPWRPSSILNARLSIKRFNSATAVKPWRHHAILNYIGYNDGFNSATAVKPWRPYGERTDQVVVASLQFGHGG